MSALGSPLMTPSTLSWGLPNLQRALGPAQGRVDAVSVAFNSRPRCCAELSPTLLHSWAMRWELPELRGRLSQPHSNPQGTKGANPGTHVLLAQGMAPLLWLSRGEGSSPSL